MFKPVTNALDFPQMEHRILKLWEEKKPFDLLREKNKGGARFSFLDGPITANNLQGMGVHHVWGRTYKDVFQRYKAMQGFHQRYQNGFDCQGLWVEVEVEKELGFRSKRDIEGFGIAPFVERCKDRVRRAGAAVVEKSIRLGQWMDWEHSYWTMSDENNYTIWQFLKKCYDQGWIYKGHDVMPWCARCGTVISDHEIATEGYKELTHSSVVVRFPLADQGNAALLVWTTTPWTLTSNVAAAVHPELTYLKVAQEGWVYYVSKGAARMLNPGYKVLEEVRGGALVGWRYHGPFDDLDAQRGVAHFVIPWKEISEEEGTGIVHIAPGCGKEDLVLSREHGLSVLAPLDEYGVYVDGFGWLTGRDAAQVAQDLFADLDKKGILYKSEKYTHRYPVCWRCDTELVFRLVDEWFISMDALRCDIMEVAKQIAWIPAFGLDRELDWLRNMHDWCISKKRYWGLALPIYECSCGHFEVIGSETQLKERAVAGWEEFEGHSPHRPWVDAVRIQCPKCSSAVSRIPDVGNPWLDAGIVPYSTMGYRRRRDQWEKWFPADFITETFALQFRNWFYALLAMSTALEGRPPFRTVLAHGLVRDEHGEEMHKSKGNAIWFDDAVEHMGADVMRWMFASSNPFTNINFGFGPAEETKRKLLTLWNSYGFFVTYAALDGFDPKTRVAPSGDRSVLDRWLVAKLHTLVREVRAHLDRYNVMGATKAVEAFLDDLSNWYIRRSRRRFWKSVNDADKLAAYSALYEALVTLSRVIAPIVPFLAEELHQNLACAVDADAPPSVHLCDYPQADEALIDQELIEEMALAIRLVKLGRSARNTAQIKVRQPLERLLIALKDAADRGRVLREAAQIQEELNLKRLEVVESRSALVEHVVKPNLRALGGKYGRRVPAIKAALEVADGSRAARELEETGALLLTLDGEALTLLPEEVLVETRTPQYLATAEEDGYWVALDTRLSEDLLDEGLAREFIHLVQNMRKAAGFEVADRIRIFCAPTERLKKAVLRFQDHIQAETLCVDFVQGREPGEHRSEVTVNDQTAYVAVERTSPA